MSAEHQVVTASTESTGINSFLRAQYIIIGTGGAGLSSSFPKLVGWGKAAEMCMTGMRASSCAPRTASACA